MTASDEWWEAFFAGPWLEVQRRFWTPEQTLAQADLLEKLLEPSPDAPLLDVPCGEGRLALELASRGYRLTGVDMTASLLDNARRQAATRSLSVRWEQRDMRDLPWRDEFDGAFCFWGSFGYFDDAGNAAFLAAVQQCLRPGARFVVETHVAETLLPRFRERDCWRVSDVTVLEERRYDHILGRIEADWTFLRGADTVTRPVSIRIYSYAELRRLFEAAGFDDCRGFDTVSGEPFALGSQRLAMVGTKP